MRKKPREKKLRTRWSKAKLEELIGCATVDAADEEEQQMGFYTAIEDHVKFPFKTALPGGEVAVQGIGVDEADEIVAVCLRGRERLAVSILDLPLPKPPPKGAEWIEAYRLWAQER